MAATTSDRCEGEHPPCLVRVLGPVDVVVDGTAVTAGGRLERTLLAALAVSANHAVPADQLAEILWGDNPPSSRDNTLQSYVSRLRHLIGHDRILSEDHCYVLAVADDELDAVVFEDLARTAADSRSESEHCSILCRRALSLWRGEPFGGLAGVDPFRLEAMRLDEVRLFVVELRMEADIALGRGQFVVGALTALTTEYPYRERMWHLLTAALAVTGRRTEALRTHEELRKRLAEVGLDPSPEARQLQRCVLDEDADITSSLTRMITDTDP